MEWLTVPLMQLSMFEIPTVTDESDLLGLFRGLLRKGANIDSKELFIFPFRLFWLHDSCVTRSNKYCGKFEVIYVEIYCG